MKSTKFQLTITFNAQRKNDYRALMNWLFQKESFTYTWSVHREGIDEIELTIEGYRAVCLMEIAELLSDIQEGEGG